MTDLNPRLNAFRDDLADVRLQDQAEAQRYVEGKPAWVTSVVADLRRAPEPVAGLDSQLLLGDPVTVFDRSQGWAWVQGLTDGYVGYVDELALTETPLAATHRVSAPRTFVYPGPDMKLPVLRALSMGTNLEVASEAETRGTRFLILRDGAAVIARHLQPVTASAPDYVSVAETLLNTPYLWGGTSGFGIDCSGLVQLSQRMAGRSVQRDTSMQETSVGKALNVGADLAGLQRGDLVFWKGHVAIMTSATDMIHANGHTMQVSHEGLADAVKRIDYLYGAPTSFRRPA